MEPENSTAQNINEEKPTVSAEINQKTVGFSDTPADAIKISAVRTYKSDLSETVNKGKIDTSKILIAEQKRQNKEILKKSSSSIENPVNKFKLILSVILIAATVILIAYAGFMFWPFNKKIVIEAPVSVEQANYFVIDTTQYVDTTERNKDEIIKSAKEFLGSNSKENTINQVVFYKTSYENSEKVSQKMSANYLINLFDFRMPEELSRAISGDYIYGNYYFKSSSKPFVLFKMVDFPIVYESMFMYEKFIVEDFKKVFGGFPEFDELQKLKSQKEQEKVFVINASTTLASSTSATTSPVNGGEIKLDDDIKKLEQIVSNYQKFIDMVLQNSDSRAVLSEEKKVAIYYTFIDREWVLFANDIEVLKEIKRRLREKNLSR